MEAMMRRRSLFPLVSAFFCGLALLAISTSAQAVYNCGDVSITFYHNVKSSNITECYGTTYLWRYDPVTCSLGYCGVSNWKWFMRPCTYEGWGQVTYDTANNDQQAVANMQALKEGTAQTMGKCQGDYSAVEGNCNPNFQYGTCYTGFRSIYGTCSSEYQQATAFNNAHTDMTAWWYFTTTSGGTEYKCMSYYVDTQGDAWEVTIGAYDTVNPVGNTNCMTKAAFDARNNTDCANAPDANGTCTTAQYGNPGATAQADECGSGTSDQKGQTGCSN